MLHPDQNMMLNIQGNLWVPVEITMLGTNNFVAAWRRGAEEWNMYEEDQSKRGLFLTSDSQQIFGPVGLLETDLGLQYGTKENIVDLFAEDKDKIVQDIVDSFAAEARDSEDKRKYNTLGIIAARMEKYSQAETAFRTSLSLDRNYLNPQVNLGNVYLLQERYIDAIQVFHSAEENLLVFCNLQTA